MENYLFVKFQRTKMVYSIFILFIFLGHGVLAQKRAGFIYPTIGLNLRSTAMNFFNFRVVEKANFRLPYSYEKNVQGVGISCGLALRSTSSFIGGEYYANFRYDYLYGKFDSRNTVKEIIDKKSFLIDHNFNLYFNRKTKFGFGITILNNNKGFEYFNGFLSYQKLEFKTYNVFVILPVKNIFDLEIKALYIPNGFPYNPIERYIMYSLRMFYTLDFY